MLSLKVKIEISYPKLEFNKRVWATYIVFHHSTVLKNDTESSTSVKVQCMQSEETDCAGPQRFNQKELNDFVRNLNLWKEFSELVASRLNEKNLIYPVTNIIMICCSRGNNQVFRISEDWFVRIHTSPMMTNCEFWTF